MKLPPFEHMCIRKAKVVHKNQKNFESAFNDVKALSLHY